MSNRLNLIIALAAVCLLAQAAFAQDPGIPDTVYFGENGKAYAHPGNLFRIPVYVRNDEAIVALSIGLLYNSPTLSPQFDSVSKLGSVFMYHNYFDIGQVLVNDNSINGIMPDSLCLGGVAMNNDLPPGRHKYCDIWFTGGGAGDQILADSTFIIPSCRNLFALRGTGQFIPQFVMGTLTLVESPSLIFPMTPSGTAGDAATAITWEVSAEGYYPPITIVLDSLVGPSGPLIVLPPTSGTNPLSVTWTPTYDQAGNWTAHYSATDTHDGKIQFTAGITVYYVEPPCQVLRGDADCNGMIDIDDIVMIIQYVFAGGPPPGCPEK